MKRVAGRPVVLTGVDGDLSLDGGDIFARAVPDLHATGHGTPAMTKAIFVVEAQGVRTVSGFTRLYIHPDLGIKAVGGLPTGFHDPMATHLSMLYALAGEEMVRSAYREAVRSGYLWHEFGDSNLILP